MIAFPDVDAARGPKRDRTQTRLSITALMLAKCLRSRPLLSGKVGSDGKTLTAGQGQQDLDGQQPRGVKPVSTGVT